MKKIIINADDFGYDEQQTMGIVEAFKQGLITNTTVMVNMPYFSEACQLAEQYGFYTKVGLHLNLVEGVPLTKEIRKCTTFCNEDGLFHGLWRQSITKISHFTAEEANLLRLEIQAQFKVYIESGFTQKHFDTHGHAHTYYSAWKVIKDFIVQNGDSFSVRIAKNKYDEGAFQIRNMYKRCINCLIPKEMRATEYFTNVVGLTKTLNSIPNGTSVEIMCHPSLSEGIVCNLGDLPLEWLTDHLNGSEWCKTSF